ncbi:MAG: hypothetical protein ACKV2T_21105 [Kofleriaceae bacterium]
MTIRFPPERRQPPPHYLRGARASATIVARQTTRAIVHPDAVRIVRTREPTPFLQGEAVAPHAIAFSNKRPPPGTVTVEQAQPRAQVRAVVHADARLVQRPRPIVELSSTDPVDPHPIAFVTSTLPPRYR